MKVYLIVKVFIEQIIKNENNCSILQISVQLAVRCYAVQHFYFAFCSLSFIVQLWCFHRCTIGSVLLVTSCFLGSSNFIYHKWCVCIGLWFCTLSPFSLDSAWRFENKSLTTTKLLCGQFVRWGLREQIRANGGIERME